MRFEPVKIQQRLTRTYRGPSIIHTSKLYFAAVSRYGTCSHRHRTSAAAEPCQRQLLVEWKTKRYGTPGAPPRSKEKAERKQWNNSVRNRS